MCYKNDAIYDFIKNEMFFCKPWKQYGVTSLKEFISIRFNKRKYPVYYFTESN